MQKIIDGLEISKRIKQDVARQITEKPKLDVILVGDNPASQIYVRNKVNACSETGIVSQTHILSEKASSAELEDLLAKLGEDEQVNGILLQLPLPKHLESLHFCDRICPNKDVDVFHPENVGLLVQGRPRFRPCTPHAVQLMLAYSGISVKGKHVVVVNRSNIVGKPLSSMLIQDDEYSNATVTVCHDNTPFEELMDMTKRADIIVVAVGKPKFLTTEMVVPNQVVIDVGISRVGKKIVGDVDSAVYDVVSRYSPVPKGVGPCTIACLTLNTLEAWKIQRSVRNIS